MAKTYLKLLKVNCSRLRKSLSLEAFACLDVLLLGHDGSVLLSVVAQALLCNFLVCRFLLSVPVTLMMAVSGSSRFLRTSFRTGARHRQSCRMRFSPLWRGECP
jgi:hypothetical protein